MSNRYLGDIAGADAGKLFHDKFALSDGLTPLLTQLRLTCVRYEAYPDLHTHDHYPSNTFAAVAPGFHLFCQILGEYNTALLDVYGIKDTDQRTAISQTAQTLFSQSTMQLWRGQNFPFDTGNHVSFQLPAMSFSHALGMLDIVAHECFGTMAMPKVFLLPQDDEQTFDIIQSAIMGYFAMHATPTGVEVDMLSRQTLDEKLLCTWFPSANNFYFTPREF